MNEELNNQTAENREK